MLLLNLTQWCIQKSFAKQQHIPCCVVAKKPNHNSWSFARSSTVHCMMQDPFAVLVSCGGVAVYRADSL